MNTNDPTATCLHLDTFVDLMLRCCIALFLVAAPKCYALTLSDAEKDYLRQHNTIVFVSQSQYPPFEFLDANGQHEGMMLDVVRWIAVEAGFKPVLINMTFQQAQQAVLSGRADILTSLFYSDNRSKQFAFTDPLFDVPASIFVKAERTDIKDIHDLNGKIIAIQQGDYAKEFLDSRNIHFQALNTGNFSEAVNGVVAGKADAVIGDDPIVLYDIFSNRLTDKIKKIGEPLYVGQNCMASDTNHAVLIDILNKGIHKARASGILNKICQKWLGKGYGRTPSLWERHFWLLSTAVCGALILLLGAWIWNVRLRSLVRKKTEDLLQREKSLKDSEEKFRSIYDNSLDGILFTVPDGSILSANPAACQMLDCSEQELCEHGRYLVVDRQDPRLPASLEERQRTGRFRGELNYKRNDGSIFPVELSSTLFTLNNGAMRASIIFRDISERKHAEEQRLQLTQRIQQAQKAESLARMAGAVAHHFNNQLQAVTGNMEIAIHDLPPGISAIENLKAAMQAAGKAAEVSSLMLTCLGLVPGKRELLDISEFCAKNLPIIRAAMQNVILETAWVSPGPTIMADSGQIQQIILNLVTNAWEAASGKCEHAVRLRTTTVSLADIPTAFRYPVDWKPDNILYACLEVADSGCGIADNDVEKIFDPFFSSKFTGRGLGLPVVLGIVRAHGGGITVQSSPGQGSIFRIFIPVAQEKPAVRHPDTPPARTRARGGAILLVEDDDMVRTMLSTMIQRLGLSVITASNGMEAVETFRRRQDEISCVLSDLTMPHMDGWETLTALRQISPELRVILSSGYDETHVMSEAHSEHPQAFLRKPYRFEELRDTLNRIMT